MFFKCVHKCAFSILLSIIHEDVNTQMLGYVTASLSMHALVYTSLIVYVCVCVCL